MNTTFEEFNAAVMGDQRSSTLDPGNIKMTFNSVSLVKVLLSFQADIGTFLTVN